MRSISRLYALRPRFAHLGIFLLLLAGLLQPAQQTRASCSKAAGCTPSPGKTLGSPPTDLAQSWAANVHLSGHVFYPGDKMTATVTGHIAWCKKDPGPNGQGPCFDGIAWGNDCPQTDLTCTWTVSEGEGGPPAWTTISFEVLSNMDYAHSDDYYVILDKDQHLIDGHVKDEQGNPVSGVNVAIHGPDAACVATDGSGYYNALLQYGGAYRVTPNLNQVVFKPADAVVSVQKKTATADFIALLPQITGISPDTPPVDWKTPIEVHGRNLRKVTAITFFGLSTTAYAAKDVHCSSDTLCTATTPIIAELELPPGSATTKTQVQVSGPGGDSDKSFAYNFRALSIVQLGDSVASGEGTLEGWTYDTTTQKWVGGNQGVPWPGPYPLCHDSPNAYGQLVATALNATFTQLACTGASWIDGITVPKMSGTTQARPAEFGDWSTGAGLNQAYDDAHPDIVLVTMGADDIQFADIVTWCVTNSLGVMHQGSLKCTNYDPGDAVQRDYFAEQSELSTHYALLAQWIEARGKAAHHVPRIVFTNYYNPFPRQFETHCPDVYPLAGAQFMYLSGLQNQLTNNIKDWVHAVMAGDKNVDFADFSTAMDGHEWCTSEPWAYGLSILLDHIQAGVNAGSSKNDQAPFHPTPQGQQVLASIVQPAVQRLLPGEN